MSEPAKTAVVCDSTSYLPAALRAEQSIDEVSLYVTLGGEQWREIEIDDYGAFFGKLRDSETGATTSQPSVGDFIAVYQPHLNAGREIASIHLSAAISGTFEAANQARDRLIEEGADRNRIQIFDSRSACGGMGMTVLAACKAAAGGSDAAGVIATAQAARAELKMWFAVDTLDYLRMGGRIGAARAWLGSALQIKPILTLEEEVTPVERVRTRRRAFERLMKYARELKDSGRDAWIVQHIQDPENAQRLAAEAREVFGTDPVFISEIGPVIGAHTGPGLLGIGGLPSRLLL